MNPYEKHVFDAILGRRSIRAYREDKQVEHGKIVKLLHAGMAAPSACNIQPWKFIVPESVFPIGVVYFAYAAERLEPRTKYVEEAVYWQKYDPEREHLPRPGNLFYEKVITFDEPDNVVGEDS